MKFFGEKYRDEIRFANLALMSGRQMTIRASMMVACLVAIAKTDRVHWDPALKIIQIRSYGHTPGLGLCTEITWLCSRL